MSGVDLTGTHQDLSGKEITEVNNHQRWLEACVHLREALHELEAIQRTADQDTIASYERGTAAMVAEALREPYARTWHYVRQHCSLEEIAARNL
jgi:hypothetical protein